MTEVRTYRRPLSTWWWLRKRSYFVFVMRELSSIFVAWFVVFLLLLISAVGRGEAAYQDFLDFAANPAAAAKSVVEVRKRKLQNSRRVTCASSSRSYGNSA